MPRRSVILALVTTALLLFCADRTMGRIAANFGARGTIKSILSAPLRIDVLAIGNSLIAAGFDANTVQRAAGDLGQAWTIVNGALGGSGVIEHLALTRLALRHHKVKVLIYGFYDHQLSADIVEKNSELIGNHNVLYYLEPELTLKYSKFNAEERAYFNIYRRCTLLEERGSIWAKVEQMRRKMANWGMPAQEVNEFGRKADFSLLEASDPKLFSRESQRLADSGKPLSPALQALLWEARHHGTQVIVVEMPMHPHHVNLFYRTDEWKHLRLATIQATKDSGALYLNASDWVTDPALFPDTLHLNKEGANRFSELLAAYLTTI